jgi:hypothetical protein
MERGKGRGKESKRERKDGVYLMMSSECPK